jgi:hypothetical protein
MTMLNMDRTERTALRQIKHSQKGLVRGFSCPIMNDATQKQIAAVKLIDSKGSHI